MALVSIVASVCAGFRGGIFSLVDYRVAVRVRRALYTSIVYQEIGFFDKTKTGSLKYYVFLSTFLITSSKIYV